MNNPTKPSNVPPKSGAAAPAMGRRDFLNEISAAALGIRTRQRRRHSELHFTERALRAASPLPRGYSRRLSGQFRELLAGAANLCRADGGRFHGAVGRLHPSGLHHGMAPGRQPDRLPLPRQQVQPGWDQGGGPCSPAAAAFERAAGPRRPAPRGQAQHRSGEPGPKGVR